MKKNKIFLALMCVFNFLSAAIEQLPLSKKGAASVLDELEGEELTEQEMAALAVMVPSEQSLFQKMCTSTVSTMLVWCLQCQRRVGRMVRRMRRRLRRRKRTA